MSLNFRLYFLAFVIGIMPYIAHGKTMSIVTEHFPPLQMTKDHKVIGGLTTEIVQLLLQRTDIKARFEVHSWARAYKIAQQQENAMIYSITRNAKRETDFKWVGPILALDNHLWRLRSRNDIKVIALEQAKQYITAVPKGDVSQQTLHSKGFVEPQHLEMVTRFDQAIEMLFLGRVDLIAGSRILLSSQLKSQGKDIHQLVQLVNMDPTIGKLHIAFNLKTPDAVVAQFQQALDEIKSDGSYHKILLKWRRRLNVNTTSSTNFTSPLSTAQNNDGLDY